MRKDRKSGPSKSVMVGIIAVVFMIIGYQTALFIHNAAVTRIAANRDQPDTVYIYEGKAGAGEDKTEIKRTERKNSKHSPVAEAVRESLPSQKVESFRFNPNKVSVEDLCRLGFSQKQAQSIENYRKKGGKFHRREDFSKSYVVSDSIYRRLADYIDIPPTDLNLADSAALDDLPGIGGWFAQKIIEHRNALGGYSCKEQLMDIYKFDREKYEALEDLVIVDPGHIRPYPLWNMGADSLRRHPYIKNYETARSIVFFREHNPKSEWTVEALEKAGILSPENASKLSRCLIAPAD